MRIPNHMKQELGIPSDYRYFCLDEKFLWNVLLIRENGFREFYSGLGWSIIRHFLECRECRDDLGLTEQEVREWYDEMRKEWQKATGRDP